MSHFSLYIAMTTFALISSSLGIEMPPECEEKTYCTTKPEEYSIEEMDHIVKISKYWLGIGNQNGNYEQMEPNYNISDGNNCGFLTQMERPYIIKAQLNETNSENKIVIQSSYFNQTIQTTTCFDKALSCFDAVKAVQDGISTRCDESYSTITIYVLENGKIVPQPFQIPVSCSCKVEFTPLN